MAIKTTDQITIVDLTDAYSVILTNEAHTFLGDTDSVNGTQTATVGVMALRGAEQINAVVGTVTAPTGITVSNNGATPSPTLTITASSAVTTAGTITIPVTVDGDIVVNKVFSYSIAFTGATGDKGATGNTGATGKGVKSTVVDYIGSASGTTVPTGSWGTSIPSVPAGQYLWTRTVTTYTDNTSVTGYSIALQGQTGATGNTGGTGKGVKSTDVTYQGSTSGTVAPTGSWATSIPSVAEGSFLWTRTIITYTDNSTSTGYSVAKQGAKGSTGATGAAGADAITLVVTSSNGFIFKNSAIATTLTAHVYKAGVEVTGAALTALGTIKWYKDGSTTASGTGATLSISSGDVTTKASYTAQLEA